MTISLSNPAHAFILFSLIFLLICITMVCGYVWDRKPADCNSLQITCVLVTCIAAISMFSGALVNLCYALHLLL